MNKRFIGRLLATILVAVAQVVAGHVLRDQFRRKGKSSTSADS